jgi:hypothetical protein
MGNEVNSTKDNNSTTSTRPNPLEALIRVHTQNPSNEFTKRYSYAPIASKDEQAELIRKQKAKLERHFRRSTQAVSYEDIKSAEATIKGNNNSNNNTLSVLTEVNPNSNQDTSSSVPSTPLTTTTPFTPQQQQQQQSPSTNSSNNIGGVSSLSSLFGVSKKSSSSNLSNQAATLSPIHQQQQSPSHNSISSSQLQQTDSPKLSSNNYTNDLTGSTTSTATSITTNGSNGTNETANDIETDKLLNIIEKSKGFLDSSSTQAANTRRLRNRANRFVIPTSSTIQSTSNIQDKQARVSLLLLINFNFDIVN